MCCGCDVTTPGEFIEAAQLPPELSAPPARASERHQITLTPGTTVDEAEMRLIEITLAHTGQNRLRHRRTGQELCSHGAG